METPPMSCTSFAVYLPPGPQIADQRRAREHLADIVEGEGDSGLVGDRRQMQRGIGRAAGRGDDGAAILDRFARHDFARQRSAALAASPSPDLAGALRDCATLRIDAGHHRRIGHRQAHRFRHHRHGVGGELPGAGADRRRSRRARAPSESSSFIWPVCTAPTAFVGIEHGDVAALEAAGQRAPP